MNVVRRFSAATACRSGFSLQNLATNGDMIKTTKQPNFPARTRFAPSPTGSLHLGSLRTALYNYLLARSTGGQFLLRLEDTDQNRLVPGAEQGIYKWLKWAGLDWDEGPTVGGPHGPYRQSERTRIYREHVERLVQDGLAYRCFCSKERLNTLAETARRLQPPSLASYDRKCATLSMEESAERAATGERHVVRFKSPDVYPSVDDIVHGNVNMQIQINASDKRYDDPVLLKSDGLPTYHLANVVDDHYMKITHVIRGDEWLASTPKHLALYDSFGWKAPHFCHIPLLTSLADKKLSKRSGDTGLADLAASGFLPEALVNFVALYGWSPVRTTGVALSEEFSLARLEKEFSLDGLTRGNAKVDRGKLKHFNSIYFRKRLLDPAMLDEIVAKCLVEIESVADADSDIPRNVRTSRDYISRVLRAVHDRISTASELMEIAPYFFTRPDFNTDVAAKTRTQLDKDLPRTFDLLDKVTSILSDKSVSGTLLCTRLAEDWPKKDVYVTLRYALSGGSPGVGVPELVDALGANVVSARVNALKSLL